jgi:hypothetical protein
MVVQMVEKSNVLMVLHQERDVDCMYSSPRLISTKPGIASVRVTMKPGFGRPSNITYHL